MKTVIIVILLLGCCSFSYSQSFKSTKSETSFFSSAPLEDIKATNTQATSLFNAETGEVAFIVPIRAFKFRKSLMQQHFNENYLESDRYPQATFEGRIQGYDMQKTATQEAWAEGTMTIHGVSRRLKIKGKLIKKSGELIMESKFPIKVADYDIEIPRVVFYNIAEVVEVSVRFVYKPI
jgi:polyisoprenoid-binding protein YceI